MSADSPFVCKIIIDSAVTSVKQLSPANCDFTVFFSVFRAVFSSPHHFFTIR